MCSIRASLPDVTHNVMCAYMEVWRFEMEDKALAMGIVARLKRRGDIYGSSLMGACLWQRVGRRSVKPERKSSCAVAKEM